MANQASADGIQPELMAIAEASGYSHPKLVGGKLCAIANFNFTYGLLIDIKLFSYGRRYCFQHLDEAVTALYSMTDPNVHVSGPWIKCKGTFNGTPIDLLNPDLRV